MFKCVLMFLSGTIVIYGLNIHFTKKNELILVQLCKDRFDFFKGQVFFHMEECIVEKILSF